MVENSTGDEFLFFFGKQVRKKILERFIFSPGRHVNNTTRYFNTIGALWFDSRRGLGIFLFITASRTALEPTQPPIQWVSGVLSLGVKRPGREADHLPPSSAEVKECVELYLYTPVRLHGMELS
jgi:hypothetical protein